MTKFELESNKELLKETLSLIPKYGENCKNGYCQTDWEQSDTAFSLSNKDDFSFYLNLCLNEITSRKSKNFADFVQGTKYFLSLLKKYGDNYMNFEHTFKVSLMSDEIEIAYAPAAFYEFECKGGSYIRYNIKTGKMEVHVVHSLYTTAPCVFNTEDMNSNQLILTDPFSCQTAATVRQILHQY